MQLLRICVFLVFGLTSSAIADRAKELSPPTFTKEGVLYLEKHCLRCHGEKVKRADLSLHSFRDEKSIVEQRKIWQRVIRVVKSGEMPPPTRPRPALAETEAFLNSIQRTFEQADRIAKPDPGRVTVRRLNRVEYNNTIRDLVGVDFNPAEDFPSDDVGHGFDNVGDVLTLPPVLMERYLAAAESIMQRAIVPDPPKPPERYVGARYLEPAQSKDVRWRPLSAKGESSLHSLYQLTMEGEYVLRVRVYGESPDSESPRISLKVDAAELQTFEIKERSRKSARTYEAKVTLKPGRRRGRVTLLPSTSGKDVERKVFVEWLALIGPSDTRPLTHRRLLAVTSGTSKTQQTKEVLTRFVSRAYRRPAETGEIERLCQFVDSLEKSGAKWESAMQIALQSVLVSPKFLFRLELDEQPRSKEPYPLTEHQLASRLSYFLWSSMPDQELFELASKKQLTANLEKQVQHMLKDPKAYALVENFALQWLQLRRLHTHSADPKLFNSYSDALKLAMLKETELFFWEIIREDRSILDLISGKYTYVNRQLAQHYGLEKKLPASARGRGFGRRFGRRGGQGSEFVRIDLSDTPRAGILTHASVLTVTSNPTRTSPVKRGKWILEQILGTPPPPPPPDVPELKSEDQLQGTLRQQMEQHRKNPACANCHAKMDPIGFAFEEFDAIGRFRTHEGKSLIDTSGVLPDGTSFRGAGELRKILTGKNDLVARCLTEKMLTYALGRGIEHYDSLTLDQITRELAKKDYRFSVLVIEIAKSFPFRMRRGTEIP